ncbi:unnamed protein product [Periconia digitata]|uniref:Uncharacterized protein n=1 Tax=Periconia digitata TaxID=1303443 RepID=A0A9W4XIF7_9PLEO|nr:unnamed protein product [Periconia digitata]
MSHFFRIMNGDDNDMPDVYQLEKVLCVCVAQLVVDVFFSRRPCQTNKDRAARQSAWITAAHIALDQRPRTRMFGNYRGV